MKPLIPVLAAFLLLATSAVYAQPVPSAPYTGTPVGTSSGDVIWSQLDEPSGHTWIVQAFEATYAGYDSWGADDFLIPATYTSRCFWRFGSLYIPGTMSVEGSSPHFVNVAFYEDGFGHPSGIICEWPANTNFTMIDGALTVDLSGCNLNPGYYDWHVWFSLQVRMDFDPMGLHRWATRTSAREWPALWKNPGNAFGNGCLDWQPMNAVCGVEGEDWLFEVSATKHCYPYSEGVPTVGPFGVVVLVLALGGGSAYVLRRGRG